MLGAGTDTTGSANIPLSESEKTRFRTGVSLIRSEAYAQGYIIFNDLSKKPNASILFNLSLCQVKAGEHQAAARTLEQALQTIPSSPPEKIADGIYTKLRSIEKQEGEYKAPFDLELPTSSPQYARECIRRCLVDSYLEIGAWDKVRSTAAMIGETGFNNVDAALSIAKTHGDG